MHIGRIQTLRFSLATIAAVWICQAPTAKAGWTGLINGAGVGWGSVNVRSVTLNTNKITTPNNISFPSTSIKPFSGYTYTGVLPSGASTNTYAKLKGLSGGIWSASSFAAAGDGTDNPELENRIIINPANCASLSMDSSIDLNQFETNHGSGIITVNAQATAGTALWLRGFEYTNEMSLLPPDDPTTPQNETIEYLKANGVWKFETLIVGPFDFSGNNGSCPLLIPFTLDSGNVTNLIFAVDGVTKTVPFSITCPPDVVVNCGSAVKYAQVTANGGCGAITGTWSLPETYAFPVNVTTPVTVTAQDESGATSTCTFNVTVVDTNSPVVPVLPDINAQCSATPLTPVATDSCKGSIPGTTTTPFPITTQGTTLVTWKFDDGNGNISTAIQKVIIKDTIAPVAPALPDLTFSTCTGSAAIAPTPTATDNCKGTVTGTTTTKFPITTIGTNVVTWTFDDGNGNVTIAKQNVILNGFSFLGFYAPINGTGGTCKLPLQTINAGSVIPIKFDMLCGSTYITTGTPPVVKIQSWVNCAEVNEPVSVNAVYQNDWHFNWDTTGWAKGIYKVIVILPDGTSQFVFVKLK
ncbi:MAG TPA: PxKF domain-containing protein [Patescibacteria group bacterium]|nr:PxKF domain-containing protein [Patescibacteria group bacterium]